MESFEEFSSYKFAEVTEDLINSLNLLLDNLDIPIEVESPYDLTPSLLLAILESTLKSRLPLSEKLRTAASPQSKVESIKVFLGVLGNDVLHRDLSSIDPRRLARGELKEVAYVGGLLVQVAKQNGMLSHAGEEVIDVDPESSYSDSVIDDFNRLRVGDYNKDDGQDDEEYEPSFDTSAGTSSYSGDLLKTPPQTPMYLRFQMEMQSTTTNTPRGNPLSPRELNLQKLSSPISQSPPTSPTYRSPYGSYSTRQSSSNQVRTSPSVPTTTYRSNISSTIQPETNKLSLSQRSKPSSSSSPAPDRSSTPPLRPLPEKESTPPTTVKKPLYMGYKPSPGRHAPGSSSPITSPASSSSPPVYIRTPKQRSAHWMYAREEEEEGIEERQAAVVVEHSTCSCAMTVGDDETVSTVNCHCEIHGEDLSTYQEPAMYEEEPRDGDRYKQKQGSVYKGPSYREQHYSGSIGRRGYDGYTAEFITGGGPRSGESEDDAWARRGLMGASHNRTTYTQKGNDGGGGGSLPSRVRSSRDMSSLRQPDQRFTLSDEFFQLKAARAQP